MFKEPRVYAFESWQPDLRNAGVRLLRMNSKSWVPLLDNAGILPWWSKVNSKHVILLWVRSKINLWFVAHTKGRWFSTPRIVYQRGIATLGRIHLVQSGRRSNRGGGSSVVPANVNFLSVCRQSWILPIWRARRFWEKMRTLMTRTEIDFQEHWQTLEEVIISLPHPGFGSGVWLSSEVTKPGKSTSSNWF
jgi:hypothetical protein